MFDITDEILQELFALSAEEFMNQNYHKDLNGKRCITAFTDTYMISLTPQEDSIRFSLGRIIDANYHGKPLVEIGAQGYLYTQLGRCVCADRQLAAMMTSHFQRLMLSNSLLNFL